MAMTRRQLLSTLTVGLAAAGLAACGRKNSPKHPGGSEFPHEYPYFPPEKRTLPSGAPEAEKAEPTDTAPYLKLDPIRDRSK
tara:strand:- start:253 stop:498 length:246 start_codon:yes stop_codon:yes gene_type:complete